MTPDRLDDVGIRALWDPLLNVSRVGCNLPYFHLLHHFPFSVYGTVVVVGLWWYGVVLLTVCVFNV